MLDKNTDDERSQDVEDQDAVDVSSSSLGDVATRSLTFAGCVGNDFRRQNVRESSPDESIPHGQKFASITLCTEGFECSRIVPIAESESVVSRCAAKEDDNTD